MNTAKKCQNVHQNGCSPSIWSDNTVLSLWKQLQRSKESKIHIEENVFYSPCLLNFLSMYVTLLDPQMGSFSTFFRRRVLEGKTERGLSLAGTATSIFFAATKVLLWQTTCLSRQNTSSVVTIVCLPWQNVCHDKIMFVAYFCCNKRHVLSWQK